MCLLKSAAAVAQQEQPADQFALAVALVRSCNGDVFTDPAYENRAGFWGLVTALVAVRREELAVKLKASVCWGLQVDECTDAAGSSNMIFFGHYEVRAVMVVAHFSKARCVCVYTRDPVTYRNICAPCFDQCRQNISWFCSVSYVPAQENYAPKVVFLALKKVHTVEQGEVVGANADRLIQVIIEELTCGETRADFVQEKKFTALLPETTVVHRFVTKRMRALPLLR